MTHRHASRGRAGHGRRRPRRRDWAIIAIAIIAALLLVRIVRADGGVTADARHEHGRHAVGFVAPMAPRIGVIDVSLLLTPTPPESLIGPGVRAVHLESGITRSAIARPAHQGNRLLRSALIEVPRAGRWRIEIDALLDPAPPMALPDRWPALAFEIEVAPELPPWRTQLPWLLAWIPISALLLWRDRLMALRRPS